MPGISWKIMHGQWHRWLSKSRRRRRLFASLDGIEASVNLEWIHFKWQLTRTLFVASITLYPPTDRCTYDSCDHTGVLKKSQARNIVVYTLDGAYPAVAIHLTCDSEFLLWLYQRTKTDIVGWNRLPECNTSYRNNYSVQHHVCSFYGGIPDL